MITFVILSAAHGGGGGLAKSICTNPQLLKKYRSLRSRNNNKTIHLLRKAIVENFENNKEVEPWDVISFSVICFI